MTGKGKSSSKKESTAQSKSSQEKSSEEEVNHKKEDQSSSNRHDEEPRWYHYVIVLAVFAGIIGLIYGGIYLYETMNEEPLQNATEKYKFEHKVGNVTYNLYFNHRIDELESYGYPVEATKIDVLNTRNFTFSYLQYNGSDNGKVVAASTKFMRYLRYVYRFSFDRNSFQDYNMTNCSDSTMRSKVVVYDPYADENGVFFNRSNGCLRVTSTSIERLSQVNDLFIYSLTQQ